MKIEQRKLDWKPVVNSGAPEGSAVPSPYVTPVQLLSYVCVIIVSEFVIVVYPQV
jgi:hypothetical protein